jgi:hypothetical protein
MLYIEEPVLVPGRGEGKKIGTLKVGDLVIAMDGVATEVTAVSAVLDREVFRVTCEDGSWVRSCEEQEWRVMKVRDAKAHVGMNIGSLRGMYEREPCYMTKFGGLRPTKIEKIESIGIKPCVAIKVAATDGLYVMHKAIVVKGGEP